MGSTAKPGNHALIFGATGIQGWAVTNQLLQGYPTADSFARVTALANRPPSENLLWPKSDKLQIVSGINLLNEGGQEALEQQMKDQVPGIETVTHLFFFAYIFNPDPAEETRTNVALLHRAVTAAESLSAHLQFVLLPTGTKAYGVHCLADFPFAASLPLAETLPRIPEPWRSANFYYAQTDWLASQSRGKGWTWCEVRPDVVVGFVPNNNVYCLAQTLATYLSCVREVEGEGAEVAFPGNGKSWVVESNDSSQDVIARFCIHAALHPRECGRGQAFNVADHREPSSWEAKWPVICEFFGLKGVGPPEGGAGPQPLAYLADHIEEWKGMEKRYGLVGGRVGNERSLAGFDYFIMTLFDFDRPLDLGRMLEMWGEAGKGEEVEGKAAWWTAFGRFRDAGIIP
ncbi:hypothetical protein LTR53_003172 [Teratosphaeriaceae sp. CCFEE 6253]|nr:hypothetical protein LTR53_003172 [Teratosphaeriaceae sp. CCFEE 6253]